MPMRHPESRGVVRGRTVTPNSSSARGLGESDAAFPAFLGLCCFAHGFIQLGRSFWSRWFGR